MKREDAIVHYRVSSSKLYLSYIIDSIKKTASLEHSVYLYLFLTTLSILHPLDKILLLIYTIVYATILRKYSIATGLTTIIYYTLYFLGYHIYSILFIVLYTLILSILSKKKILALAIMFVGLVTYFALTDNVLTVNDYGDALRKWIDNGIFWWIPLHLVIASIVFENTLIRIPFVRDSRLSKYFIETPGAIPVVHFIVFLITASIYLALGTEALANRLTELAYYSLVIGVSLEIYSVLKETH